MLGKGQKKAGSTGIPSPADGTGARNAHRGPDPFRTMALSVNSATVGDIADPVIRMSQPVPLMPPPPASSRTQVPESTQQSHPSQIPGIQHTMPTTIEAASWSQPNLQPTSMDHHSRLNYPSHGDHHAIPSSGNAYNNGQVSGAYNSGEEFDFDAFLANFGIGSDITELLGDLGDSA
jgi:hypothetical protein